MVNGRLVPVERGSSQDVLDPVGMVQPREATLTPVAKDLGTAGADKGIDQELDFSSNNEQGYQGNHNHGQIYPFDDPTLTTSRQESLVLPPGCNLASASLLLQQIYHEGALVHVTKRKKSNQVDRFNNIFAECGPDWYSQGEQLAKRMFIQYLHVDNNNITKIVTKLCSAAKAPTLLEYRTI